MTADLLTTVVAAARCSAEERERRVPRAELDRQLSGRRSPRGRFRTALRRAGINVIAECKRRSPSRGVLRADYDPVAIAASYERAGAAAISVLTEPTFFDGSLAHLRAVRDAVGLPLLRKDFVVLDYQIAEAAACGADAVLLIVAALDDGSLRSLLRMADDYGLDTLVEVHDQAELDRAVDAGAMTIGVNSRNLRTLEVDRSVLDRLLARVPTAVTAVAESGLTSASDLARLRAAGYHAFLIGERFMTDRDPGAALAGILRASSETVS